MCGICGYTGRQRAGLIEDMMGVIKHRGPNDQGSHREGDLVMGMVRLSIIDLAGGKQPISNETGDVTVVFNGEIFNYIELREELKAAGHVFATNSDTETIVHAYEEYGLDFPHKLNGMFAVALRDRRRDELILVRDRFGVKPLYYSHGGESFAFASEIKALLLHPQISREVDYEALSHYLSLRNIPAPFTIYKAIRALPPGCALSVSRGKIDMRRWYSVRMSNSRLESEEEKLVEEIDGVLRDSVRIRMRSDVEYGAYLSGGIDSSTITAIMSEFSPAPVKTFCLTYKDRPDFKQDAYYAKMVAHKYGTLHHEYEMDWTELARESRPVARHLDQPFAGVIASYWLSRYMSRHITVALSGDGADDLFASYGHLRLTADVASLERAISEGRDPEDAEYAFFGGRPGFVREMASYPPWERRLAHAAFMQHEKKDLLSEKGAGLMGGVNTAEFLREVYAQTPAGIDDVNKTLYMDVNTLLHNEILFFNDMLSMAHSIEVRTPFLDYRMVELACSIPGSLKIRGATLKYILRKAAARYLPKEILDRPKEGFVLPKNQWMRRDMLPIIREALSEKSLAAHGLFRQSYVDRLLNKFLDGDDSLTHRLWTLVMFQLWHEENEIG